MEDEDYNLEKKLLLSIIHKFYTTSSDTKLEIQETRKIDWINLLKFAGKNGVIPLLWTAVKNTSSKIVPKYIYQAIEKNTFSITQRNIVIISELKKILEIFECFKTKVIVFKGPVLLFLYPNISLRACGDIDLLILKKDIGKVTKFLHQNGYDLLPHLPFEKVLKEKHALTYLNKEKTVQIDVHWRMQDLNEHFKINPSDIWNAMEVKTMYGSKIPVFNNVFLIISTCIHHGFRNNWSKLKYISDFALILKSNDTINWEAILRLTDKLDLTRTLLTGAILSYELLEIQLPDVLIKEIKNNKKAKKISTLIITRLYISESKINNLNNFLFNYLIKSKLRQNFIAKVLLLKEFLTDFTFRTFEPNELDKQEYKLPWALYPLYIILKPVRLLSKFKLLPFTK